MALTLTDVSAILKTKYLPVMEKHINTEDFLTKWVEKHKQVETVGNQFTKSFKYSHSEGTGMLTDVTGQLSPAQRALYKTFTGSPKWRDGRIRIYEAIVHLMNTDEKSFIDEITSETEGITDAMKCEKERMNFGDGGNTPLAIVDEATATNPSVISLASGSTTQYLRPGMPIDFLNSSNEVIENASGVLVGDIIDDYSFTLVHSVAAAGLAAFAASLEDAKIFHKGGYKNEFYGLKALIGTNNNTVLGVNRALSAGAWFRPTVQYVQADGKLGTSSAATGSHVPNIVNMVGLVQKLLTQKKAKKKNLVSFATAGVAQTLVANKIQNQEYIEPSKKIDLWPYEVVTFNGIPILSGNYCPDNTIFINEMSGMVQFLAKKLGFSDMDGNMWKWVNDYAAYEAFLLEGYELGHYKPWQCATIYDVASAFEVTQPSSGSSSGSSS